MPKQRQYGLHQRLHEPWNANDWKLGVWNRLDPTQIPPNALADAENVKVPATGRPLETRDGTTRVSLSGATWSDTITRLGGIDNTVVGVDENRALFYWDSTGTPTLIQAYALDADRPAMLQFGEPSRAGGQGLICADGGPMKVWRGLGVCDQLVRLSDYGGSGIAIADGSLVQLCQFVHLPMFNEYSQGMDLDYITVWVKLLASGGSDAITTMFLTPDGSDYYGSTWHSGGEFSAGSYTELRVSMASATVFPGQFVAVGAAVSGAGSAGGFYELEVGDAAGLDAEGRLGGNHTAALGTWVDESPGLVLKVTAEPDWYDQRSFRVLTNKTGYLIDTLTGMGAEASDVTIGDPVSGFDAAAMFAQLTNWWASGGSSAEIRPEYLDAYVKAVGAPSGNAYAMIWDSDGAAVVTGQALDVATLDTNYTSVEFPFATRSTIAPGERYYVGVFYESGVSDNYITLGVTLDSQRGMVTRGSGAAFVWAGTEGSPMLRFGPGLAPDADNLVAFQHRLMATKGRRINYSNILDPEDWTDTYGASGYIERMGEVAGIVPFYDDQVIFFEADPNQMFRLKIVSINESNGEVTWAADEGFPGITCSAKFAARFVGMDVLVPDPTGLVSIKAVDTYGDLAQAVKTDAITDYHDMLDANMEGVYYHKDQYYLMFSPSDGKLLGFDTRNGGWWPWPIRHATPTALRDIDEYAYLACNDGHLYVFDEDAHKDHETQLEPMIKLGAMDHGDSLHTHLMKAWAFHAACRLGAVGEACFWRNDETAPIGSSAINMPIGADVTVDELGDMTVDEALFLLTAETGGIQQRRVPKIRYKTLAPQFWFETINDRLTIDSFRAQCAQLGRRAD